jgi:hypothetical protein
MKKAFLVIDICLICTSCYAQYMGIEMQIGVIVGVNQFSLNTSNFITKSDIGWNAGLSVRGNFIIIGTWCMLCSLVKIIFCRYNYRNKHSEQVNYNYLQLKYCFH